MKGGNFVKNYDLDNLQDLIKYVEKNKTLLAMKHGAKLQNEVYAEKFKTVGVGVFENFVLQHSFEPQKVVFYSDAEGDPALIDRAVNLSKRLAEIKVDFLEEDLKSIDKNLAFFKKAADEFLNDCPQIFTSYGTYGATYYNYFACLEFARKNIFESRLAFIRSMVYECLYRVSALSIKTYRSIVSWSKKNSPPMLNFNFLSDKKIKNPFAEVKFHNLVNILISYLLFLSEAEVLSHAAYWANITYIKNLLQISSEYGDFHMNKNIRQTLNRLIIDKQDFEKMTLPEWQRVTPDLETLSNSISGTTSVEELVNKIWNKYK